MDPVTPATVRFYDRRARDLRAAAQAATLRRLFLAPWLCLERLVASAALYLKKMEQIHRVDGSPKAIPSNPDLL
jgi:hypothetical protein